MSFSGDDEFKSWIAEDLGCSVSGVRWYRVGDGRVGNGDLAGVKTERHRRAM